MWDKVKNLDSRLQTMLGVVLVLSLYWAYQWLGTATIRITSEPEGALVMVDGLQQGVTPIERLEVDAGQHRIVLSHSHYAPHSVSMALRRGDHESIHARMEAGEGTLELLSNPRGSWVEIDGERLPGRTPMVVKAASGPREIRMGQDERRVVTEVVTLKHGEAKEVNLNLNMDPHGTLTIAVTPYGAKVEILDSEYEYEPKMRIRIGEYSFRVSREGYLPQTFRHKVRYGENLHQVELVRGFGQLHVRHSPEDAEVQITYELHGKTRRLEYEPGMQVPLGRVEVRVRAIGYRTAHRRFNMTVDGATTTLNLQPMRVEAGSEVEDRLKVGGTAPSMVVVPAGRFVMGDADGSLSEKPAHEVVLTQPFALSKTEVTVGDYLRYANATGAALHEKLDTSDPDVAVAYVTFAEAMRYAEWLSDQTGEKYRLPTEAEWEYAARAGSQSQYFFGDDPEGLCQYGNVADQATKTKFRDWEVLACDDGLVRVGPVGRYEPNAFGLHDVYGNVAEWVLDCGMPKYSRSRGDGSAIDEGEGCGSHGYRGGSWDSLPAEARSAYRNSAQSAADDRGIRLLREL